MIKNTRQILRQHWHVFTLLACTWFFGYSVAAHASTPLVALYYVVHILAGSALSTLTFFLLLPRKEVALVTPDTLGSRALTRQLHKLIFHLLMAAPILGVLVFFVPDGPWHLMQNGSFWWTHVYHDNLAHLAHAATFYLVLLLGSINWLWFVSRPKAA